MIPIGQHKKGQKSVTEKSVRFIPQTQQHKTEKDVQRGH